MLPAFLLIVAPYAAEIEAVYDPVLPEGGTPTLKISSPHYDASVMVECSVNGQTLQWAIDSLPAGATEGLHLPASPSITSATCQVAARYANGHAEGVDVAMQWRFVQLEQQGASAEVSMDPKARVATVPAPFEAVSARIQALDRDEQAIFEEEQSLDRSRGRVTVRWKSAGIEKARTLRITLEGPDGQTVTYDLAVRR
jgi:hypothetical protein